MFAYDSNYDKCGPLLHALKSSYDERKGSSNDQHFEILYVELCHNKSYSPSACSSQKVPWSAYSCGETSAYAMWRKIFKQCRKLPAIAVFGPGGHPLTKESNLALENKWSSKFPFIEADMGQEVRVKLVRRYRWDLELFESPCLPMGEELKIQIQSRAKPNQAQSPYIMYFLVVDIRDILEKKVPALEVLTCS